MRSSTMAVSLILAMAACSPGHSVTGPAIGPAQTTLLALYQGSESGPAGLVEVEVRIHGRAAEPTALFAGQPLVELTIDGRRQLASEPTRFRVNGRETSSPGLPDADVIEVYAGLGGDQDWITALRVQ